MNAFDIAARKLKRMIADLQGELKEERSQRYPDAGQIATLRDDIASVKRDLADLKARQTAAIKQLACEGVLLKDIARAQGVPIAVVREILGVT